MAAWRALGLVLLFALPEAAASEGAPPPAAEPATPRPLAAARRPTPAEQAGFEATPGYDATLAFLRGLARRMPELKVTEFGRSGAGRPLPLAILSKDRAFTPEAARRSRRPVVLVVSGIHAGEIDGKDATLILLRDLAEARPDDPWRRRLLEAATVLFVPIYNVDGHERVSPHNRPNQDGPRAGMGFRTTAAGLDLNRDHIKLDSPEARALVGLFNRWRPHLHIDNHVTDGSDHAWTLTYARTEAPQIAPGLEAWLAARVPGALEVVAARGFRSGPYVDLVDGLDPTKGISSWVASPRHSTGYVALRNRASILVEMHSYKPYRERVLANLAFLEGLIEAVGRDREGLVRAVAEAEAATVAAGAAAGREGTPGIVLAWGPAKRSDRIRFPVYDWAVETSFVTGQPLLRYRRGVVREIDVPWFHGAEAARTAPRPHGYLVLPGWPMLEERLRAHGLVVRCLLAEETLAVDAFRTAAATFAGSSYQGRIAMKGEAEVVRRAQRLPAGTLWVPADQPDFEVAVQLLDPQSPESLQAWGGLASLTERKEYIDGRVLEGIARSMVERDPALAEAWSKALEDPEFAKDRGRRHLWWYQRSPHWDATQGESPVFRAAERPRGPLR